MSRKKEKGAVSFEAAIVLPVILLVLLTIFQTLVSAQTTSSAAQAAADEAARAASMQQTSDGAYKAANDVLITSHNNNEITCGSLQIDGKIEPGGTVETSVTCSSKGGILSKKIVKIKTAIEVIDISRSNE